MQTIKELKAFLDKDPAYIDLGETFLDQIVIDLKYATPDNFSSLPVYGDFKSAYLHVEAAQKFEKAVEELARIKSGFKFIVYDALRPHRFQVELWKYVVGTPSEKYLANPARGSVHNYGFAIDLSIIDSSQKTLDMGTAFDAFDEKSEPRHEQRFLEAGALNKVHLENRALLNHCLVKVGGFYPIDHEWWHFDGRQGADVRQNFLRID